MIGQDAVTTAQAFLDGVGYDGVVLTKLDGDARGGAALSIAQLTGRPVMFASTGEKLEDFDVFHPDRMASRILDMGDILTLIEQAERTFDAEQTAAMAGKLTSGEGFTLEDFVEQLAMVRKLGPIGNLLGMLPGAAQNKELLSQVSDSDLDRAAAIVNSMTPAERRNPKILNGSRRARIAKGSGTTVGEVNNLVIRFQEGQKMMRQMLGGGGVPGMPPIPGMRRAATKAAKGKKGSAKKKQRGGRPGAPGRSAAVPGSRPPVGLRPGGAGLPGSAVPVAWGPLGLPGPWAVCCPASVAAARRAGGAPPPSLAGKGRTGAMPEERRAVRAASVTRAGLRRRLARRHGESKGRGSVWRGRHGRTGPGSAQRVTRKRRAPSLARVTRERRRQPGAGDAPGKRRALSLARVTAEKRLTVSLARSARAPVTRARTVTPPMTARPGSCPRISRRDSAGGSWAAGARRSSPHRCPYGHYSHRCPYCT